MEGASPETFDGTGAELAAQYLLVSTIERAARKHQQGKRQPPLACATAMPTVRRFALERFHRVPTLAAQGLVAWAEGTPVELLTTIPPAEHVLALQALGARCVSLLPEAASSSQASAGFDFAVHDLCHLAKFVCSEYHLEQVGFFASLRALFGDPRWQRLESRLDAEFVRDRDQVAADMNGSSVFLFAAFKMKLKMAARRLVARTKQLPAPTRGALEGEELDAFNELFNELLEACSFGGRLRAAALGTSARRDAPELAAILAQHFRDLGSTRLARRSEPQLLSARCPSRTSEHRPG
jgi:hypothetical protein